MKLRAVSASDLENHHKARPDCVRRNESRETYEIVRRDGYIHDVGCGQCDTVAKLVEYVRHLLSKEWIKREHIRQLIDLVRDRYPSPMDGNA